MDRYGHCERAEAVAFWHTIKESMTKLSQEMRIDRVALEHTDNDYIKHVNEKVGYEISRAINERPEYHNTIEEDSFMGKTVTKEVYVLDLTKIKEAIRNDHIQQERHK